MRLFLVRTLGLARHVVMSVFLFTAIMGPAVASPAYGTKMPDKGVLFGGLQSYFIEGRGMEGLNGTVRSRQEYAALSYGLSDWFSLDLKWMLHSRFQHDPQDGGDQMEYNRSIWGGGYGFRVRAYQSGPVRVVAGFQHFSNHPATVKANGTKQNGILEDWQGSTLVSYSFKRIVPYAGVRYATLDYIHTVDKERARIRSEAGDRWSPLMGADIPVSDRVWLNLEVDPQDGGSYTTAVFFRF